MSSPVSSGSSPKLNPRPLDPKSNHNLGLSSSTNLFEATASSSSPLKKRVIDPSPERKSQSKDGEASARAQYSVSSLRELSDKKNAYVDVRGIASAELRLGSVDTLNSEGNRSLTSETFQPIVDRMKKTYPKNPFKPNLSKTGQILWSSDRPVNATEVAEVVDYTGILRRNLHINTGTHGDKNGETVVGKIKYGESKFSKEDLTTAWDLSNVSVHIVSHNAPAFHPDKIDSIDAWCYSQASQHTPTEDSLDTSNFFTKIYQLLCRESGVESKQEPATYVVTSGQGSHAIGSVTGGIGVNYGDAAQGHFHGPVHFGGTEKNKGTEL